MKTKEIKAFDAVAYFRAVKEKLAARMNGKSLEEQKDFLRKVRNGEINLSS
jgi:hypothetical protein